jgi:hypothetical protein
MRKTLVTLLLSLSGVLSDEALASITLTGTGEYVASTSVDARDAYTFAKNRALANASEKASLLVESDRVFMKSNEGSWSKSEIRQLSSSLILKSFHCK